MSLPSKLKSTTKSGSGATSGRTKPVIDSKAFAGRFVATLKAPLRKALSKHKGTPAVDVVLDIVQNELEAHLMESAKALPVHSTPNIRMLTSLELKPAEVVAKGLVSMSQATLYRAVADGRFYCVAPKGLSNGRLFPAWQFVDPVPDLLEPVLRELMPSAPRAVHAFFVSSAEELNELSPAEVLAGLPFETRSKLHASQHKILALPDVERQRLVLQQIAHSPRSRVTSVG